MIGTADRQRQITESQSRQALPISLSPHTSATHPDVALAGEPALRHSQRVEERPQNVQQPHQDQPAEAGLADLAEPALDEAVVDGGNDARQAEAHEDSGAQRAQVRFAELVPERHDDREDAEDGDDRQVNELLVVVAVEAVVQPGHEGAHDEQRDAAVVQLREELAHVLRVAAEGVEGEGEAQADDGADEEGAEDQLLLPLDLDGGPGEEVAGDAHKGHAAQEVCPDVARLRVDPEHRLEALAEGGQWRPVARVQKVVVLQPLGQVLVVAHLPRGVPHLPHKLLRLLGRVVRQGAQVDLVGENARLEHLRYLLLQQLVVLGRGWQGAADGVLLVLGQLVVQEVRVVRVHRTDVVLVPDVSLAQRRREFVPQG